MGVPCWTVVGYTFNADIYCADCMASIAAERVEELRPGATARGECDGLPDDVVARWARAAGVDYADEATYDSGDFPKVVFADADVEDDRCSRCAEALV